MSMKQVKSSPDPVTTEVWFAYLQLADTVYFLRQREMGTFRWTDVLTPLYVRTEEEITAVIGEARKQPDLADYPWENVQVGYGDLPAEGHTKIRDFTHLLEGRENLSS